MLLDLVPEYVWQQRWTKKFKTIALVGDAECDEGSIWEAAMFAENKLNNLIINC